MNFAVAETGTICLVTNEGNGRLVSALPRVHVALMGIERVVATLDELGSLLRLLARSGTGQRLTTYTTLITGPRREGEQDGPEELHVMLLDNGRSRLRGGRYEEMLVHPLRRVPERLPGLPQTGGPAYGPVYSGPMGAVLVPLLVRARARGRPAPRLVAVRCVHRGVPGEDPAPRVAARAAKDLVEGGTASRSSDSPSRRGASPGRGRSYRLTTTLARLGQPLAGLVGPGRAWRRAGRTLPRLGRRYRDG